MKFLTYLRVASSNTSGLEPRPGLYRLLMKGIFDAYALWPFDKKIFFELVTRIDTCDGKLSKSFSLELFLPYSNQMI